MSIFNVGNKKIQSNNDLSTLGGTIVDQDRYISPSLSNVYTRSTAELNVLSGGINFYKHIYNVIPYRASTYTQLYGNLYKGSFVENATINIYSNRVNHQSVFGVYLDETSKYTKVELTTNTITTNNYIKNQCIFNTNYLLMLPAKSTNVGEEFTFFENGLLTFKLNPKYIQILHPITLTKYKQLYNYLDVGGNANAVFNVSGPSSNLSTISSITLRPLRLAFSKDNINWYKYNFLNEQFELLTFQGSDLTYLELCANGNSYIEYTKIPLAKFENTFTTASLNDIITISNGWVLGFTIKHQFYKEQLDIDQFIWCNKTDDKINLLYGDL